MAILDYAIEHIRAGRPIFPGIPDEKIPAIKNPYEAMSRDEKQIMSWWKENPKYNILLPMGVEVEPGKFLGAIDFDVKDNRNGFETADKLAALGLEFAETLEQITPNNGIHKIYYFDFQIGNGVNSLGPGIDHRGYHGYILSAGSWYHGKEYVYKNKLPIAAAQEWLARRLQRSRSEPPPGKRRLSVVHSVDQEAAERRALQHLEKQEVAREGERNHRGYQTACQCKDEGVSRDGTFHLMLASWKCEPMLEHDELWAVVNSAFKYGQNTLGLNAPEVAFDAIPEPPKPKHPIDLNGEFAYVTAGGGSQVLWFTTDYEGKDYVDHLSVGTFHEKMANRTYIPDGGKRTSISKSWMEWPKRQTYDGVIFAPNFDHPRFFNKWRGFLCDPLEEEPTPQAINALEKFKDHIVKNVAKGDIAHANWIFSWFANLFQCPEVKPRTALVLRGKKGVGKSVIFDCLSRLIGGHYCSVSNRRYLSGNFNSHLEDKILYVLEEAFWSGSKDVEGILKDLVTGKTHMIERKGREPYTVKNLARVVILGNDEWIVPASEDERRYAVFDVAPNNQNDKEYFKAIAEEMDPRLLLKFFKEFNVPDVDINTIPKTDALMVQKEQSLAPLQAWWLASLKEGHILGGVEDEWPKQIIREQLRGAFTNEADRQNLKGRRPSIVEFGRILKLIAPSSSHSRRKRNNEALHYVYDLAPLEEARKEWEHFIGGPVKWETKI